MIEKNIDSLGRLGFALLVFLVVLCGTELLLSNSADFNAVLTNKAVQQGYFIGLRAVLFILLVVATVSIATVLRRGIVVAPLIWAAQIVRVIIMGDLDLQHIFFVSDTLNIALLIGVPIVASLLLWQGLELADPSFDWGFWSLPLLWTLLAFWAVATNIFVWYWSNQLIVVTWPVGYALLLLPSLVILIWGAPDNPLATLAVYFTGIVLPTAAAFALWGIEGLYLVLLALLPWGGFVAGAWFELMLVFALPILLVLATHQLDYWRRGRRLVEII